MKQWKAIDLGSFTDTGCNGSPAKPLRGVGPKLYRMLKNGQVRAFIHIIQVQIMKDAGGELEVGRRWEIEVMATGSGDVRSREQGVKSSDSLLLI